MTEPVPDLLVEKLALGELSNEEEAQVRARLGPEADERLAAVARSNAEILELHPPDDIARRVAEKAAAAKGSLAKAGGSSWWLAVPTLAAAAGVALWITSEAPPDQVRPPGTGDDGPEVIVLKGDAQLLVYRQTAGGEERLADGDQVSAGEVLQLSYRAAGQAQGVIISLDGAGAVTVHHPSGALSETALAAGGSNALPEAFELDAAPGFERFFFVAGPDVELDAVRAAVEGLAKGAAPQTDVLNLPDAWQQQSVLLRRR